MNQTHSTVIICITFILHILSIVSIPQQQGANHNVVYFPSDNGGIAQIMKERTVQVVPPNLNLSEIRGTSQYEKYVNNIISLGIGKITLAVNKILVENENVRDNVVFSPTSIAGALALVLLGSNGKTYDELLDFMGLASGLPDLKTKPQMIHVQLGRIFSKLLSNSGFKIGEEVNHAMSIFVQEDYPIRPLYKQTAEEIYRSYILNVDFERNPKEARKLINDWVSQETKGKITNILNDIPSPYTKVILTSATYFKAAWEQPFFPGSTRRRPFYIDGRKSQTNIEADLMANGGTFPYYKDLNLGCEVLGFPYQGNRSTMYVVMPINSSKENLKKLVGKLNALELNQLAERSRPREAVVLFPKMKLESTIDLKDALQFLGVRSLFNPDNANLALLSAGQFANKNGLDSNAIVNSTMPSTTPNCTASPKSCEGDLKRSTDNSTVDPLLESRIGYFAAYAETLDSIRHEINAASTSNKYQNPGLYADSVVHKVNMEITESGTEAAAATSVSLSRDGSKITFRVDVPFFFFIRHEETKTVIFWGSVLAPTPSYKITK